MIGTLILVPLMNPREPRDSWLVDCDFVRRARPWKVVAVARAVAVGTVNANDTAESAKRENAVCVCVCVCVATRQQRSSVYRCNSQFPAAVDAEARVIGLRPACRRSRPMHAHAHVRLVYAQSTQPRGVTHDSHMERPVWPPRSVIVCLFE